MNGNQYLVDSSRNKDVRERERERKTTGKISTLAKVTYQAEVLLSTKDDEVWMV